MTLRNSPDCAPWMIRWSYVLVSVMTLLTPRSARVSSHMPAYGAGYSIAPTPMMAPWPGHQARDGVHGADAARVGQRDRGAGVVVHGQLVAAGPPDDVLVRLPELAEVHRARSS